MNGRERFVAAASGRSVDRPPVWFMRQAGRYLPEYQAVRREHGFRALLENPALASDVTLQPVKRFGLDAAIVMSDLLVPFEGLGRRVAYGEGGPSLAPLKGAEEIDAWPAYVAPPYVSETVRRVRRALPDAAVVGFAGAPFTLACYLVEGGASKDFEKTHAFASAEPAAFRRLLDALADVSAAHLRAQLEAGADAAQLFDTWAETLSPDDYAAWALPATRRALSQLPSDALTIHFARGTAHLLPHLASTGARVHSVDWRVKLADVARTTRTPVQGNLDPRALLGAPSDVRERTRAVVDDGLRAGTGHVFNLGHGILPSTPLACVEAMVAAVKEGPR